MVRGLGARKPIETPGGPVDPAGWAKYLSEPLERTTDLLIDMDVYSGSVSASVKRKAEAMKSYFKLSRRAASVGRIFCNMAGLERRARELVYKGGRTEEKIKKPKGPVNVA